MPTPARSTVLTLRVPTELDRRIEHHARKSRRTKSAVLREAIQRAFGDERPPDDPATEARRQSLLVGGRASERDVIAFVEHVTDRRGWR